VATKAAPAPAPAKAAEPTKAAAPAPAAAPPQPSAPAPKAPARSVAKPEAKPAAKAAAADSKVRKPKLVRDSFTMPKAEYALIDTLKERANALARPVKKSELLRAGIQALQAMNASAFLAALKSLPAVKTGRPKKG
jgi:hypothetical protein